MSSDDELEGSDEKDLREHFAPVARSARRAVTSRTLQVYTIAFVGVVVLSASIGPTVVGAYAVFQEDFDLCSDPYIEVLPPEDTEAVDAGAEPPEFERLDFAALTADEQRAFRAALDEASNEHPIEGESVEHLDAFRDGVLVEYEGAEYYVAITSNNECVTAGAVRFPLSIAGLVIGSGMVVAPELQRRFGRKEDKGNE
ncbi:hypothetical protein [Halococcus agarilyticus]|uniref:hypothetical protein n=1 Tax=Halococcus agarilyticus TaxID=1232219 RepID=UPI000677FE9B|nr:hypothetical protein [Halococcus agarilyticus]